MTDAWTDVSVAVPGTVALAELPGYTEDVAEGWTPSLADEFWKARASLARIHQFARARRAAPWATLGVVLARIVAATPPHVVLPALVGGHGSLNLFAALVAPSSGGKGSAEAVAIDAVPIIGITSASVGSGEGIAHLYARRVKGVVERHTDAVLLTVTEVDTLAALGSRQGSTLLPELRRAWSGESLGFSYADPDKRLPIGGHTYRLSMTVGVQPNRAGGLLDDADGGTPQRFIWLPATDPGAPDEAPVEPPAPMWGAPTWPKTDYLTGRVVLPVCATARSAVDTARLARLRDQPTDLDGHALFAQLKTAAALAILDGRAEVAETDWQLAGVVAVVSRRTRDRVSADLERAERVRNRRRGEAEADRAVVVAERMESTAQKRIAKLLLTKLSAGGGWITQAEARRMVTSRDRVHFDGAIDRLIDSGVVEAEEIGSDTKGRKVDGHRYRAAR